MRQLVEELHLAQHVWTVRPQLVHLQHHHLARRPVRDLRNIERRGRLITATTITYTHIVWRPPQLSNKMQQLADQIVGATKTKRRPGKQKCAAG